MNNEELINENRELHIQIAQLQQQLQDMEAQRDARPAISVAVAATVLKPQEGAGLKFDGDREAWTAFDSLVSALTSLVHLQHDAPATDSFGIQEELRTRGGDWIGRARRWMQSHIHQGSHLTWNSTERVSVAFCDLQDLALAAATGAIYQERQERVHQENLSTKLLRSEMRASWLQEDLDKHKAAK